MRPARRTTVRTGFLILICLLLASTIAAYRVQETFSQRSVEIHQRYVYQQELHTNLRRTLWMAGIEVRDYFLNPSPDRHKVYQERLRKLTADCDRFFAELEKSKPPTEASRKLRNTFEDLWKIIAASPGEGWDDERKFRFVQEEVVPRRNAAGQLLQDLERANRVSLTASLDEFAANRSSSATRLLMLLGSVLLLGILVARYTLRYSSNLERQTAERLQEVSQAKQELERLSARLMEIQEEERTRLSRELHDEIVQNLAVLKIEITQAQASLAKGERVAEENLARAKHLAERTVKTVRNISLLLRPSLLDDLGLGPALQWLAEDYSRRTGVTCEFQEGGLSEDLPDAVKTCVYRVSQEALHNCEKHAAARHVRMNVNQVADGLHLEIADDGVGFRQTPPKAGKVNMHFGLLGMRERAAALGGALHMESMPGKGTTIRLWLPLTSSTTQSGRQPEEIHA